MKCKKKVLFIQRVLADYRIPFLKELSKYVDLSIALDVGHDEKNVVSGGLDGLDCYDSGIKYFFNRMFWIERDAIKAIKGVRPDCVLISPTPRALSNYIVLMYCKKNNIEVIGWGMGQMPGRNAVGNFFHAMLQKTIVVFFDKMICYSNVAAQYYKKLGFNGKVYVAHNAVSTAGFLKKIWPQGFQSEPTMNLIYVGRIIPEKKLNNLIEIVNNNPVFTLTVVGDGEVFYRSKLIEMSSKSNGRIKFSGYLEGENLNKAICDHDLFVLPSRGGLAINHAMASGLPVVVSIGDGTERDLVENGVTGFFFENENWLELEGLLLNLYSNRSQFPEVGDSARSVIDENVNLDNMIFRFMEALQD